MHYVVRRFGFRITRGWFALIIIAGALTAAAFWIGPFRPLPPRLQLLARNGDGTYRDTITIPSAWADSLPAASEATARFPLVFAVRNAGYLAAEPTHLALNVPARYRLTNAKREPLPFHTTIGNPLVRYDIPIRAPRLEPNSPPARVENLDTLWLEPIVPTVYCTAGADSIPEFVAAPAQDPEALSHIALFYSFSGPRIRQRQTGLLRVNVDPNLVKRTPAANPPIFDTEVTKPEAPRPPMDTLMYKGQRTTWCGDPGQPTAIGDVLFETREGGRMFVVYYAGKPRKWLFDLNRDSVIELEMWDADHDGKFESHRPARMAIPSFLMPYTAADTSLADSVKAAIMDTTAATPEWMQTFYDTTAGVARFVKPKQQAAQPQQPQAQQQQQSVAPGTQTPIVVPKDMKVDSAWLRLFDNASAGVLRFHDAASGKPIPPPAPKKVTPKKQTGPKLLGVPVDSIRR